MLENRQQGSTTHQSGSWYSLTAAHAPRISQAHPMWVWASGYSFKRGDKLPDGPAPKGVFCCLLLTGTAVSSSLIWGPVQYRPWNHITATVPGPKESYKLNHSPTEMEQGGRKGLRGDGGNPWFTSKWEAMHYLRCLRTILGVCKALTARLVMQSCTCKFTRNFSSNILSFSLPFFWRWGEGAQYCHSALNNKGKKAHNMSYYVSAFCYKFYAVK